MTTHPLTLQITKQYSILNNLTCYEDIDIDALNCLIQHKEKFLKDETRMNWENETQQLQAYQKKIKNRKIAVVYKQSKIGYGRVYPLKSLGLCSMRRAVRHTLARDKYVDIDINNAHPEMLKQICIANGILCINLTYYTENRDACLQTVMDGYHVDRDTAKTLFIRLLYFGSYDKWLETNKFIKNTDIDLLPFENELRTIGDHIVRSNPDIYKEIIKSKTEKERSNPKSSTVSYYLQEWERRCLDAVYVYCIEKGLIENDSAVLTYDGLMILKEKYDDSLLAKFGEVVKTKVGLDLVYSMKDMTLGFDMKDVVLVDTSNDADVVFKQIVGDFERNHTKIVNKGVFVKQTDSKNIVMSEAQLIISYKHIQCGVNRLGTPQNFIAKWITNNNSINRKDDMNVFPNESLCPGDTFNMWRPFAMEKVTTWTHHQAGLDAMLNHITILCDNDPVIKDFLCWFVAQMIQYPERKSICPTLIGKQGGGKTTFLILLKQMLGADKYLETSNPSRDVWGDFNGIMSDAFLVNLNELSKQDTTNSMGKIKTLITDGTLWINKKGVDQYPIDSYHRFIITTNTEDPMVTEKDDRRNLIIRSSDEKIGDKKYFNNLYTLLDNPDVIKTCYEYFKNIPDMDKFCDLPIPKTEYQNNLKEQSVSIPEQWLRDFTIQHYDDELVERLGSETFEEFQLWLHKNGLKDYNTTILKLGVKLSNLRIDGIEKGEPTRKGKRKLFNIKKLKKHFNIGTLVAYELKDEFDDLVEELEQ